MILQGWSLAQQGQGGAEVVAQIRQALDGWLASGATLVAPYFRLLLAETYAATEQYEEALTILAEALSTAQASGECWFEAEMHRQRGEFLLVQGKEEAEVEACFKQALEVAARQNAKSMELRTAMSLGRLRQRQGRPAEAVDMLTTTYQWFTEGFDSPDLRDARLLLDELKQLKDRK